jgi:hypothetical protein
MKLLKILCLGILLLFSANKIKAQVPQPLQIQLYVQPSQTLMIPESVSDTILSPLSLLSSTDSVDLSAVVYLADTVNIASLHLNLGSSLGQDNLYANSISWTIINTDYVRHSNYVRISLGSYLYLSNYYLEVQVEDINSNLSPLMNYESNE